MIKKYLPLLSILLPFQFVYNDLNGQTLNSSDVIPLIGDKYVVNSLNYNFDTLQTGMSIIWDYSNMVPDQIDTFIAQSTNGSVLSNTDIRFINPQTGTAHYYNTDGSYLEYAGKDDNGSLTVYPNPDRQLIFPMLLNSTFIDSIHLAPFSSVLLKIGYVENKLDGIGTLKLPSGTFTNVFRIKSSYYLKDSSIGSPNSNPFYYVTLRWYLPGIHYPIAYSKGFGNLVTPTFEYLSNLPTSITDLQKIDFRVYPNPCTNILTINSSFLSNTSIELISIYGNKVFEKRYGEINNISIDCSNFSKGIYILRISNSKSSNDQVLELQ